MPCDRRDLRRIRATEDFGARQGSQPSKNRHTFRRVCLSWRTRQAGEALARDLAADRLDEVSLAIVWPWSEVSVSVALAGAVSAVLRALPILRNNIVLSAPPSSWMEEVKVAAAQGCAPPVRLSDLGANVIATGILEVPLIRLGDAD